MSIENYLKTWRLFLEYLLYSRVYRLNRNRALQDPLHTCIYLSLNDIIHLLLANGEDLSSHNPHPNLLFSSNFIFVYLRVVPNFIKKKSIEEE